MNKELIIQMAREAGLAYWTHNRWWMDASEVGEELERFFQLATEWEREQCAKVCDARYMGDNNREDMEARRCAAAIRARGETNNG